MDALVTIRPELLTLTQGQFEALVPNLWVFGGGDPYDFIERHEDVKAQVASIFGNAGNLSGWDFLVFYIDVEQPDGAF